MRGKKIRSALRLPLVLAVFGCHHVEYSTGPDLSGLKFYGYSRLSGASSDSITLQLYALNRTNKQVRIEFGLDCGFQGEIRAYRVGKSNEPAWDFAKWKNGDGPAVLSCFKPDRASIGGVLVGTLDPGRSIASDAASVPVRVILGDSLPPGRYRFVMSTQMDGTPRNLIPVGVLDVPRSPVLTTSISVNRGSSEKGTVRGQVIDSLSEEIVGFAVFDFARIGQDGQLHTIAENASNRVSSPSVNALVPRDGADGFIVRARGYYPVSVRFPIQNPEAYRVRVALQRNPADQPPSQRGVPSRK